MARKAKGAGATPSQALTKAAPQETELTKYDPEVQALLQEAQHEEQSEIADLNKDAGLPRINVKNAPDEFSVVILAQTRANAYWKDQFKPNETGGPDCSSNDGITGQGKRFINGKWYEGPQSCEACPLNEFGTKGDDRRAKACRNMRALIIQRLEHKTPAPELLVVPPTGLRGIANYLRSLVQEGIPRMAVQTIVEKVDDDRSPLGRFEFSKGAALTGPQMAFIAPIWKMYRDAKVKAQSFNTDDLGTPAGGGSEATELGY